MKNLIFLFSLIFISHQSFSQDFTFTNTGNAHNAPYGIKTWNWDTARYKRFSYLSPVDNYNMPYRLLAPPNNDPTKKYPLFIMFHGAGEGVGGDCDIVTPPNTCQLTWGGQIALDSINKYPSFVFFPQTGGGYWGNNGADNSFYGYTDPMAPPTRVVFEIIDNILLKNYNVDPDRIYVAGLSAGGRAAWEILERRPELFAAATPFSGMGNTYLANTLINNPIWNYQGGQDDNPAPFETENMYDSLVKYGGNPRRSLYVDRDHWVWVDAYQSKTWMQWIYSQNKRNIHVLYNKSTSICPGDSVILGIGYGFLQYQWQKDGATIPGATSYLFTAKQTGTYTVVAQRKDGSFMTSNPQIISPSSCGVSAQNGLVYSYYEGTYTNLPNFASLTPKKTGFINNYSLTPRNIETNYAFKFDGYLNITSAGQYTFYTNSDDGSKLYIDGVQIVNNDFLQGTTERSGTVNLTQGKHAISVTYFQSTGGEVLEVRWQGPGILKQLIPDYALFLIQSGNNVPPMSNAGADVTLTLPVNSVTLAGNGTDVDGTIASYSWTKTTGPAATLAGANTSSLTLSGLVSGTYVFRLTVTDNLGATGTDDMSVVVNGGTNKPPVANAGPDVSISTPATTATLVGSATDPDGTIASYAWTKTSGPQATLGNATTATLGLSGLIAGTYVFRLTVTDNLGATGYDEATLNVTAVTNGINYAYYEGNWSNLPAFTSLTPVKTGTTTNYTLSVSNKTTQYALKFDGYINITTAGQYTFFTNSDDGSKLYINGTQIVNNDFLQAATERSGTVTLPVGKQAISVTYFQQGGGQTLEVRYQGPGITKQLIPSGVLFTNTTPNQLPVVNAGIDKVITLPTNTLSIIGSATDSDGTIASYLWTKISGGTATLTNASTSTLALSSLVAGAYTFRLTATDNSGGSSSDDVVVTVNPANQSPVANAGQDVVLTLPANTTTLNGSGTDADGTIVSYGWSEVSGPAVSLSGATTQTLSLSGLVAGAYVFRLTVVDDKGAAGTDDVNVTVSAAANIPPVANAGFDTTINFKVNSLVLSGSGTDADGTVQLFNWTKISGPTVVLSGTTTPTLTLTALNVGTYTFRLTVTDNKGATGFDDVIVTVGVASNQPPVANAGKDTILVLPNNAVNIQGAASDPDGTISTIQWTQQSGPATTIVNSGTVVLSLSGLVQGTYVFRLTVTDNLGLSAFDDVQLSVVPSNIPPVANAGVDKTITLPINSTIIAGTGTDADGTIKTYTWIEVSGPPATLTNAATASLGVANLTAGNYVFRLTVTDNIGASNSDDVNVTVLPAANVPPVANAGPDVTLNLPANSTVLVGSASDKDGTVVSYGWTQISGPAATLINSTTSNLSLTGLVAGTYIFRLTATDNNSATGTDDATLVVNAASTACNFGTPLTTGLPNINITYTKAYVLGQGGPNLSNITSFAINWNLAQKGLYTLSFNTSNGVPNYYLDLRTLSTNTFSAAAPSITFSKTGITGFDGTYNVGISNGNFVMAEKTGKYTIYFSSSATAPVCSATRLGDLEQSFEFTVSPNPATVDVMVRIAMEDQETHVKFIDEYGKSYDLASTMSSEGMVFDVSRLLPGVYHIMVKQNGTTSIKKLVIIR